MKDEWKVGRVIARPYVGRKKGEFRRTSNRHDYAVKPFGKTVLNALKDAGPVSYTPLDVYKRQTREYIEAGKDNQGKGYDPRKLLKPGFDAICATIKEKMELFGSVGKAFE